MSNKTNDANDNPIMMLPHDCLLDEVNGLIAVPFDRVTISMDVLEFLEWVENLEEVSQIVSQMLDVELEKCNSCGTVSQKIMLVKPTSDEYN